MDVRRLSSMNSLVRHFSSLIIVSRITVMKQMLRLRLKAMRYGLILHSGILRQS
jgi:hypothetical protein